MTTAVWLLAVLVPAAMRIVSEVPTLNPEKKERLFKLESVLNIWLVIHRADPTIMCNHDDDAQTYMDKAKEMGNKARTGVDDHGTERNKGTKRCNVDQFSVCH